VCALSRWVDELIREQREILRKMREVR